jgi:hypothetical protein
MPLQIARTILPLLAVASLLGGCCSPLSPTDLIGTYRWDDNEYSEVLVLKADGTYEEEQTLKRPRPNEKVLPGYTPRMVKNTGQWTLEKEEHPWTWENEGRRYFVRLKNAMFALDWLDTGNTSDVEMTSGRKRDWDLDIEYSCFGKLQGLYSGPDHMPRVVKKGEN